MWSHINKVEDERLMIISVGVENAFIKNEHSFMIKNSWHRGRTGNVLHNKGHIWQPTVAITLSSGKLKALRSGARQGCSLSPVLSCYNLLLSIEPKMIVPFPFLILLLLPSLFHFLPQLSLQKLTAFDFVDFSQNGVSFFCLMNF